MKFARLLWNYAQARRGESRWSDRAALEAWQERRVVEHLRRVLPRSKWLRERMAGRRVEDWRSVPVVGKAESVARFDDWNTAGVRWDEAMSVALRAEESRDFSPTLRGVTVGLSSGTSGGRGIFLASAAERESWAGTILGKVLPKGGRWENWVPGRHRVALFLRAGGGLYEAAGKGRVQFRWFDLMRPVSEQIGALEDFSPTVLVAPPSALRVLLEGGLRCRPDRVVSCAETLDALDRRELEEGFGQRLHEVYQATEGFLGASGVDGVLRLNEDGMVVEREWLDEARTRFVPVITDFRRTTQPMLRHRLDDVLVVDGKQNMWVFTRISAIEGRCEDGLWAVGGDKVPVFGDSVVRAVIRAAAVRDFRVWQVGAQELEVAVEPDTQEVQAAVGAGLQVLWKAMGAEVAIQWRPMPEGEPAGVKRRRIRQIWRNAPKPITICI
jgi:putative adenylate-forming enzyme